MTEQFWLLACLFVAAVTAIHFGTAMLVARAGSPVVRGGLVLVGGGIVTLCILVAGML